jgi:hypothetical protein
LCVRGVCGVACGVWHVAAWCGWDVCVAFVWCVWHVCGVVVVCSWCVRLCVWCLWCWVRWPNRRSTCCFSPRLRRPAATHPAGVKDSVLCTVTVRTARHPPAPHLRPVNTCRAERGKGKGAPSVTACGKREGHVRHGKSTEGNGRAGFNKRQGVHGNTPFKHCKVVGGWCTRTLLSARAA